MPRKLIVLSPSELRRRMLSELKKVRIYAYVELIHEPPFEPIVQVSMPDETAFDRVEVERFETDILPRLDRTILQGWKGGVAGVGMGSVEFEWTQVV